MPLPASSRQFPAREFMRPTPHPRDAAPSCLAALLVMAAAWTLVAVLAFLLGLALRLLA